MDEKQTTAVAVRQEPGALAAEGDQQLIDRVLARVNTIQHIYRKIMVDGSDFGKIPGCHTDRPTLLKPGAEKLLMAFRVSSAITVETKDLPGGHREIVCKCTLTDSNGQILGEGVGCCSTMESKYRYRTGPKESTGTPVPKNYWDMRKTNPAAAQEAIGGKGFSVAKNDAGAWEICVRGEKVENPDPADQYNTVLKLSKKRALIDGVLTVFGASDIFTQDIEDMADIKTEPAKTEPPAPVVTTASEIAAYKKALQDVDSESNVDGLQFLYRNRASVHGLKYSTAEKAELAKATEAQLAIIAATSKLSPQPTTTPAPVQAQPPATPEEREY